MLWDFTTDIFVTKWSPNFLWVTKYWYSFNIHDEILSHLHNSSLQNGINFKYIFLNQTILMFEYSKKLYCGWITQAL